MVTHPSFIQSGYPIYLPAGLELLVDGSVRGHLPELRDRAPGKNDVIYPPVYYITKVVFKKACQIQ